MSVSDYGARSLENEVRGSERASTLPPNPKTVRATLRDMKGREYNYECEMRM